MVLDVLLARPPFFEPAERLFALAERKRFSGFLCATTVTTIAYFLERALGRDAALVHLRTLLALYSTAPVDGEVLQRALARHGSDFEDTVIHEAAQAAGAEAIVTRDPDGFQGLALPVYSPAQMIAILDQANDR